MSIQTSSLAINHHGILSGFSNTWILAFYWTLGIEKVTRVDSLKTSHFLGFHTMIDGYFDYLLGFMPPWCLGAQLPNTQSKNSLWDNKHFVHVDFFQ